MTPEYGFNWTPAEGQAEAFARSMRPKPNPRYVRCICCGELFFVVNETRRCAKCAESLRGMGGD